MDSLSRVRPGSGPLPLTHTPTHRVSACTPERAFLCNQNLDPQSPVLVMGCALERSNALIDLLLADAQGDSFTVPMHTVRNLLWLLQGQFEQMHTLINQHMCGGDQ